MKYYNSELEGNKKLDKKTLVELLEDVRKSIDGYSPQIEGK